MLKSFITITLLVIAFLFVESVKAHPGQNTTQQEQPDASNNPQPGRTEATDVDVNQIETGIPNHATENKQQPAATPTEKIQIGINLFIALVVFWQARIYNQQRKIMKEQSRMAAISERAYIGLRDFKIGTRSQVLIVGAVMINGGRTPAWGFQSKNQVYLGKEPVPFVWEESPDVESALFIAAGGESNLDFVEFPGGTQEMNALNSGEVTLFVDGECRFLDFTGERQIFAFGYSFDFESKRPRAIERYQRHYPEQEKAN